MAKKPSAVDVHVGSRVRMRRLMLAMSQGKLADAIGLTFQQVQKYEKGTNRIGASRLQQISHFLQVEPAFFFEGAPGASPIAGASLPGFVNEFLSSREGLALIRAFTRIKNADLRRRVVDLVTDIAAR